MPVRRKPKPNDPPLPQLVAAQGGRCFYCGEPFSKRRGITRDHLFPRSMGYDLGGNKVAAHPRCNVAKGDRMPTPDEVDKASAIYAMLGMMLRYRLEPITTVVAYGIVDLQPNLQRASNG